jgi:hypothetical protein
MNSEAYSKLVAEASPMLANGYPGPTPSSAENVTPSLSASSISDGVRCSVKRMGILVDKHSDLPI